MKVNDVTFGTEVFNSESPVLVKFGAEWCNPCQALKPALQSVSSLVKVIEVDIDEATEVTNRYKVRSIPTLMIFKEGQPVATHVGAISESRLRNFIGEHCD